ncbi:sel1 repeat family protein [Gallibacterium salpingitidis]|uniref:sel1 repeat family protein n=1 Tax=Gallibacterium salpingitidis TaxID=505341 RepID=UPI00083023C6|nr:sel1 repeat family protein [Gallibacterium salpingitidis]WKS99650.1 sel1 repeat family protein [Gallibacterium salpingitidis]
MTFHKIFLTLFTVLFSMSLWSNTNYQTNLEQTLYLAQKGNAEAQFILAMSLLNNSKEFQNYQKAKYWLQKAAAQDFLDAQTLLGAIAMYYNEKNYP